MSWTKEQHRKYNRKRWRENKNGYRKRQIVNSLARKAKIRKWLADYKKTIKCSSCPEKHPACLEFHHKNSKTKLFEIGNAVSQGGYSIDRIKKEIKKCLVVCSNCHKKIHYEM